MKIKKTFNTDYQQYKNLDLYNFKVSRKFFMFTKTHRTFLCSIVVLHFKALDRNETVDN